MTNPVHPADGSVATATVAGMFSTPPPMPSIAASAVLESRLLVARTRRAVATWLTRG